MANGESTSTSHTISFGEHIVNGEQRLLYRKGKLVLQNMWDLFGFEKQKKSREEFDERVDEEIFKAHDGIYEWLDNTSSTVKSFFRTSPGKFSSFAAGVTCAVIGALATYRNKEFVKADAKLVRVMVRELLIVYGVALVAIILLWPVFITIVLISPGIITNAINLSGLWAFKRAKRGHKVEFNNLFMMELETIAPKLASNMAENMGHKESVITTSRHNWHLAYYSGLFNAIGVVPVIGTVVAPVAQTLLTAEHMGWSLLKPFLVDYKGMQYSEQKQMIYKNWYMILGFSVPYVLLSSVPFVSLYTTGLAQAGAAHLLVEILHRNNDEDLATALQDDDLVEHEDDATSQTSAVRRRSSKRRSRRSRASVSSTASKTSAKSNSVEADEEEA